MKRILLGRQGAEGDEWLLPTLKDQFLSFRWRTSDLEMLRWLGVPVTHRSLFEVACNSVLTEAMLAHVEARAVSFSRHKDFYTGLTRYHGSAYTYTNVLKAIEKLVRLDLIVEERSSPLHRGLQSRLWAAPKLIEGWNRAPLIFNILEIIRLRSEEGRMIDYQETDNTRRMRRDLVRINADLATFAVDLTSTDVIRTPTHLQIDGQFYRTGPPLLFRGFNRDSFVKGGRAYGWWQNLPKIRRPQLLLNGEPTAEPDFIQMHAAMLYAERGLPLDGDAYRVGDFPRELVKLAFQVLVNAASRPGAISALMNKDGWALVRTETAELINALAKRHAPIAGALHSDRGIILMRRDSEIILRTLKACLKDGIPALPIHDSMLTAQRHEGRVAELMERSAAEELNIANPCRVRVSGVLVPQMPSLSPPSGALVAGELCGSACFGPCLC